MNNIYLITMRASTRKQFFVSDLDLVPNPFYLAAIKRPGIPGEKRNNKPKKKKLSSLPNQKEIDTLSIQNFIQPCQSSAIYQYAPSSPFRFNLQTMTVNQLGRDAAVPQLTVKSTVNEPPYASRPSSPRSRSPSRWNTERLPQRVLTDITSAACASTLVAPLITMIDRYVQYCIIPLSFFETFTNQCFS